MQVLSVQLSEIVSVCLVIKEGGTCMQLSLCEEN